MIRNEGQEFVGASCLYIDGNVRIGSTCRLCGKMVKWSVANDECKIVLHGKIAKRETPVTEETCGAEKCRA